MKLIGRFKNKFYMKVYFLVWGLNLNYALYLENTYLWNKQNWYHCCHHHYYININAHVWSPYTLDTVPKTFIFLILLYFLITERTPAEATFRGSEYLSYDLLGMNSEPILSSSDQVSLYFKSRQPSGLLFYTGKGEDHLLIALKDGGITLIIHLGSSTVEKVLKPTKTRFDDNQWHKVLVHRKVREVSCI